jgi:hypothetical protein
VIFDKVSISHLKHFKMEIFKRAFLKPRARARESERALHAPEMSNVRALPPLPPATLKKWFRPNFMLTSNGGLGSTEI